MVETLPEERALERARDIIGLADELVADFRRVREDFDQLNRQLRTDLLNNERSRRQVLEQLFAGHNGGLRLPRTSSFKRRGRKKGTCSGTAEGRPVVRIGAVLVHEVQPGCVSQVFLGDGGA